MRKKTTCSAVGCDRPAKQGGLCHRHHRERLAASPPEEPPAPLEIPGEEWRPIPRFPDYEASDRERVRNVRGSRRFPGVHVLALRVSGQGYLSVTLYRDGKPTHQMVHRLIATAFLGPKPPGTEIRHLNDIKTDNRLENLRYGTRSENKRDSVRNGIHPSTMKTHCKRGHAFTPENTYRQPGKPTHRACRTCRRLESVERRRRKKVLALEQFSQ